MRRLCLKTDTGVYIHDDFVQRQFQWSLPTCRDKAVLSNRKQLNMRLQPS
jgi:hypothetical protein